jgi:stress response protein YsnF
MRGHAQFNAMFEHPGQDGVLSRLARIERGRSLFMTDQHETLPLLGEMVMVGSRNVVTGRTRVRISPTTRQETIDVALTDYGAVVERAPVGRFVETAPPVRVEGDTTVIPVLEERAVLTVQLYLREEVHMRAVTTARTERHPVSLRSEHAEVERLQPSRGNSKHE